MFGIGLPEMIVIFAVALIVVGPDKLPELAKSLAKGLMEMKKTVNQLKDNLTEEDDTLNEVQKDLRKTADELKERMLDADSTTWSQPPIEKKPPAEQDEIIEHTPDDQRPWEVDAASGPRQSLSADARLPRETTAPGKQSEKAEEPPQ